MKNKVFFLLFFCTSLAFSFQGQVTDSVSYHQREFQENFQEQYTGSEYNYEPIQKVNTSAWDRFWSAVGRFLENLFDFGGVGKSLSGLEVLFKIIAIGVILFVVYLIAKAIINKEGGWIFSGSSKRIKVTEETAENIHSINFTTEIEKALQQKNYRVAVRYYYLWLLKSLTDKNIIEWDIEKTNSDYMREIKHLETKENFSFLSYIYEYSWYGEFELTEEDYKKAESAFVKTIAK